MRYRSNNKQSGNNRYHHHVSLVKCCQYQPVISLWNPYGCIGPAARGRLLAFLQYTMLAFVLLIVVLWIGMEVQEYHMEQAPSTLSFYSTDQVCGITTTPEDYPFMQIHTFPSKEELESTDNNTFVAHCGDCGSCSNPQDVQIYSQTKDSLLKTTVACAKKALVWGRRTAGTCMEDAVGFTAGCNKCWIENIMCDLRDCLFVCLWRGLFSQVEDGGSSQELNRCTLCDEKRCGPAFIRCAGANRRRSGILSDIERDAESEVCRSVGPNQEWWNDESIQETWQRYQEYEHQEDIAAAAVFENHSDGEEKDDLFKYLR